MAIPAGISTATITFGIPVTFQGDAVPVTATIAPSADIVWSADGTPLVAFMETNGPATGAAGSFVLPHVDQSGFIDNSGAAYKNWYFTVTLKYLHTSDTRTVTKIVQPLVGQTTIDLDLVGTGPALQPYTAPQAVATSVVGFTGAVTGTQIAADPALTSTYGPVRDQALILSGAKNLENQGLILAVGTAGAFDAGKVESPCVFFDKTSGRLAMTYTGYTTTDGTAVASIGIAYSDDGFTWTKSGQFFTASGTVGAPDEKGVTGAVLTQDNGTYHLFYIGLTAVGYEGGLKTICHATATSLSGPWTRQGTVIANSNAATGPSAWRKQYTWRSNLVKNKGQWYLFFNATGASGLETCGYATASTLNGPWTIDDANSPILPNAGHATDGIWGGDPFVYREDDHWRMEYSNADPAFGPVGDWWATTTDASFPLGWVIGGQSTVYSPGGMKPWITRWNGLYLHYTSSAAGITVNTAQGLRTFGHKSSSNFDSSIVIGENINPATGAGRAKLTVGNSSDISELIVGQDSTHNVLFSWAYNAIVNNAVAKLETYGGSNQLNIQNNGGNVMVGGSGGKLGFYGTAPSSRLTGTPAAATDLATALTLVNDLRSKLLAYGIIA